MPVSDWPTRTEMTVMQLLQEEPKGLYGLQIVEASGKTISRGSIYVLLGRLEEKGFVRSTRPSPAPGQSGLIRPIYRLTAEGRKVLDAASLLGMASLGT